MNLSGLESATSALQIWGLGGAPEVTASDDLVALMLAALATAGLRLLDGDVLTVTSKVVSKSEGSISTGDRASAIAADTDEVVARRGATTIARTRHGVVLAAAGVDASNTSPGTLVHLPADPDASARAIREEVQRRTGVRVGVVVTDTAGRPWRLGQTDLAIGAAGLRVIEHHAGRDDPHGNPLTVTAPAVADEIASASELVTRKTAGRPFSLLRGLADHVTAEHGPGAAALVRPRHLDMFALGSREAVLAASRPDAAGAFGSPVDLVELVEHLADLGDPAVSSGEPAVGCEVTREGDALLLSTDAPMDASALIAQGGVVVDATRIATALGWHVAHRQDSTAGGTRPCSQVELLLRPGPAPVRASGTDRRPGDTYAVLP